SGEQRNLLEGGSRLRSSIRRWIRESFTPKSTYRAVIMRCVSRDGKPFIQFAGNDHAITRFPLWNFESGDAERSQGGPHIFGNNAKVFTAHAHAASFLQHNAEVSFAFAFVRFTILECVVVAGNEMRSPAASSFQHLVLIEGEEFFV